MEAESWERRDALGLETRSRSCRSLIETPTLKRLARTKCLAHLYSALRFTHLHHRKRRTKIRRSLFVLRFHEYDARLRAGHDDDAVVICLSSSVFLFAVLFAYPLFTANYVTFHLPNLCSILSLTAGAEDVLVITD